MFSKNVYKEARKISEIIGIFAVIGIVGGVVYSLTHVWFYTGTNAGFIVVFCSVFLLLVAYICAMVSHIGENIASITQAEDAKQTAKESFARLVQKVKNPDKTDKP